jgi:phosphoglucomutase
VRNGTPLPDFGGHHPDPNMVHAKALFDQMFAPTRPISARRRMAMAIAT